MCVEDGTSDEQVINYGLEQKGFVALRWASDEEQAIQREQPFADDEGFYRKRLIS